MTALVILLALATFASTLLGGLVAFRNQDRLHLVLGFTAGVILGVVAFDVLPEIASLSTSSGTDFIQPMVALVVGFLGFHVVEKSILIHEAHCQEYAPHTHDHPAVGLASAVARHPASPLPGTNMWPPASPAAAACAPALNSTIGPAIRRASQKHAAPDSRMAVATPHSRLSSKTCSPS